MVLQGALIAYHNIEFIEVTVNETMFCQTNNKTNDPFKNHLWILQLLNLYTASDRMIDKMQSPIAQWSDIVV